MIASSGKAYGTHEELPYTKDSPFKGAGAHPYDVLKIYAHLIAFAFFHAFKLPVSITSWGNFYGG